MEKWIIYAYTSTIYTREIWEEFCITKCYEETNSETKTEKYHKKNTEKKTKNFEVTAKQRKVAIFCYRAIFNYLAA